MLPLRTISSALLIWCTLAAPTSWAQPADGPPVSRESIRVVFDRSVARLVEHEIISEAGGDYLLYVADSLKPWQPVGENVARNRPRNYLPDERAIGPLILSRVGQFYQAEHERRMEDRIANHPTPTSAAIDQLQAAVHPHADTKLEAVRWLRDTLQGAGITTTYARELNAILQGAAGRDSLPAHCLGTYGYGGRAMEMPDRLVPMRRTTSGTFARELVVDVFAAGLLDSLSYIRTLTAIDSCRAYLEFDVLYFAANQLQERNRYPTAFAKQRKQIGDLVQGSLLSPATADSLLASYGPRELKTKNALTELLIGVQRLDLSDYPADQPSVAFPRLLRTIAAQVGLELSIAEVTFEVVDTSRWAERPGRLSVRVDDEKFSTRIWFEDTPEPGDELIFEQYVVGPLNAALAERGDHRRVVLFECGDAATPRAVFVAALTQEQVVALGDLPCKANRPSFDSRFTKAKMAALVASFDSLGLLADLPEVTRESGIRCATQEYVADYSDVLECFPGVFQPIWLEGIGGDSAYATLLDNLSAISRGGFQPSDIHDDFALGEDRPVHVAFTLKGERFTDTLGYQSDWYDPAIMTLINSSLLKSDTDGAFHYVSADSHGDYIVWLTELQADWLRRRYPGLVGEASRVR